MRFGIQMGHGMESLTKDLLKKSPDIGAVILSPRNCHSTSKLSAEAKMAQYASQLPEDIKVYIDPQLFTFRSPTRTIREFTYWNKADGNLDNRCEDTLYSLMDLNTQCQTAAIILPSLTAHHIDDTWKKTQRHIIDTARRIENGISSSPMFATVALDAEVLKNQSQVTEIALEAEHWDVDGVYIVCEHPNKDYLTDQPLWLLNYMLLTAGLKRAGKVVAAGYGSHQMLVLGLAKCDMLFSGNYLNVRRFDTATFEEQINDNIGRRKIWYYVPQALSEFKLETLDLAWQVSEHISPILFRSPYSDEPYAKVLFSGALPSSTDYKEGDSFKHYLFCLARQAVAASHDTYDETLAAYDVQLQVAEKLIATFKDFGIFDKDRNFADSFSAAHQAVSSFDKAMGFVMRHEWEQL